MAATLTRKIIDAHLVDGDPVPGEEIALRFDQTLTQDATGTLVMLELEAMGLERVETELSAQYVDHNLLQTDFRSPDDHLFLKSACQRFGIWYSPPGHGVSHPVHMECFGEPGKTLIGSDSHTPAAGALGMFAVGGGGLDVALAMAGEPCRLRAPRVVGVEVTGSLPPFVSAKDVILELLRRRDVDGGVGCVFEYFGPGLASLSAMDRHVIANMGTELGATTSIFPSDENVRRFLESMRRGDAWRELLADPGADYDEVEHIALDALEPLMARPSSPGNVVPVREEAGKEIYQAMIGSSANPGFRDFAIAARMVEGREIHERVSFDVNPSSLHVLLNLMQEGHLGRLIAAGARVHQPGCNGCIGMGQAPATDRISLRTVPRNFPGRSGTRDDLVYLVSPETAAASALTGVITDPRDLALGRMEVEEPAKPVINRKLLVAPDHRPDARDLVKGPNISSIPDLEPLPDDLTARVVIHLEDDVSTDEILPAGANVLPYRSNVTKLSEFVFGQIDEGFLARVREAETAAIVAGRNYGQGSSREHAALAPRVLGVRLVLARSFARIHWQNLANFGVLPLRFADENDWARCRTGDELEIRGVREALQAGETHLIVRNLTQEREIDARHDLSSRQIRAVLAGSVLALVR